MLYIVGTPIGNLKDITLRAIEVLKSVPVVLIESPQDSRTLLTAYDIHPKKIIKYCDANRRSVTTEILKLLEQKDAALITSAGMPGISDPCAELVTECRARGIAVVPIPGPSALDSAIAVSGFRGPFLFIEFFPRKLGKMKSVLSDAQEKEYTLVFFESPYRIVKTLEVIAHETPTAHVFVGKEMTKKFETYLMGSPHELLARFQKEKDLSNGEFAVAVHFPQ